MTQKDLNATDTNNQLSPVTSPLLQDILGKKTIPQVETRPLPAKINGTVTADISRTERWEHFKCRVSNFRDDYQVTPGLYAFGKPGRDDDVLVSANYKLSFDSLRRELEGQNCWLLVLNTKGINVWCAAGKGTFGTSELIDRIAATRLDTVVDHRRVIVPQLGAAGVNASEVRRRTGFRVMFGPVLARDVPAYLSGRYKKTSEMRTIRFSLKDRMVLAPMEINPAIRKYPWFAAGMLVLFGFQREGIIFSDAWSGALPFLILGLMSVLAGALITPVTLPYIPFRSFAVKGWIIGLFMVFLASLIPVIANAQQDQILLIFSYVFFPGVSSYIALQFTGSTTYTGISGVKKELRIAVPLYITAAVMSVILLVTFKLMELGII